MPATPSSRIEDCLGGTEFSTPPGNCRMVNAPPESSASVSAKGVKTAAFIGCFGPMI